MKHSAFISQWNGLTADNHHGEALQSLAVYIGATYQAKLLKHVNAICEIEGELPAGIREYRNRIQDNVFKMAREVMGAEFERMN